MKKFGVVSLVGLVVLCAMIQVSEQHKLLKLAAAAAIIRGGPIIPLPVRYPVHVPKHKVVHVPHAHHVPVHVPVHHYDDHHHHHHHDDHHHGFELGHADAGWW